MEKSSKVRETTKRPDFVLMRRDNINQTVQNHFPLYIIEVKKPKQYLENELHQNLAQLRNYCIDFGLTKSYGVLTDYKTWYFTRCDLSAEVLAAAQGNVYSCHAMFEVSNEFNILEKQTYNIDKKETFKVIKVLEWLIAEQVID